MSDGHAPSPSPPAGWYAAPHAAGQLRYWDGWRWLDITPPPQPVAAPRAPLVGVEHRGNQVGRIALVAAVAGTIFACWSGWFLAGWILLPAAFVLSIVAVALPGRRRGNAVTAIVISIIGTIAGFSVFFSTLFDGFGETRLERVPAEAPLESAPAPRSP